MYQALHQLIQEIFPYTDWPMLSARQLVPVSCPSTQDMRHFGCDSGELLSQQADFFATAVLAKVGDDPSSCWIFSPSLQSFSEIRKGQERSFKNFVFSSISFMIWIRYRLASTSHTRELRRPFVCINAALGCFGMGNPTKIAIIHHPAAW